jgi:NAD(P)-dependent dehydrogenase (short-subunit alcohol dehydrogenase family)
MSGRLAGKVAVVTGAGSGIGRAAALRFAAEGARVVCADVQDEAAEATAAQARAAAAEGGSDGEPVAIGVGVDVVSSASVDAMVARALETYGRVDALYANAGVGGVGTAVSTDEAEWDRVVGVNLKGVWLCAKAVLPSMVEQGSGSIVNQASIGGLEGVPRVLAYAASKAGVIGITRQMAPGTVVTPLVRGIWEQGAGLVGGSSEEERVASASALYPLRRVGRPEDIANLALFLASDESSWVTGAVYVIDGGKSSS